MFTKVENTENAATIDGLQYVSGINLLRENTEIRNQKHEMWAEGSCDNEPNEIEISEFLKTLGYKSDCFNIEYDKMQSVWRWNCDIEVL